MKLNLKNKVALVTGGSRGIGKAICLALAGEGVKIGVDYVSSKTRAKDVVKAIMNDFGVEAVVIKGDVGKETNIVPMFDTVELELGPVDILVNNAAYCPSGPISSYTRKDWEHTFRINVTGAFLASQEHIRRLRARKAKGKIVNIASQAAFLGSTSGHLPYDSSKGALVSMTRSIASEVAAEGINVNAVAPGMVMTEMVAKIWEKRKDFYLSRIPLKRIAQPEEIANVVVFLASDAASFITGSTLDVTGGVMMR
ncbi:MAG: 3-oxoacyl-ACP reductase FabG [Kiritimatiellae bacterium]|nr:3-oxoacyl-ACP reductase FabG [Kiritimatiellia bacterium]MDD5523259.1 3-oxoacyl-ACP reductase FabG [Kiritimatiellia bacterium]